MDPKPEGEWPEALVIVSSVESHCRESGWRAERSTKMVTINCAPTEFSYQREKGKENEKGTS